MLSEFPERDLVHFLPVIYNHNNKPHVTQKGLDNSVFT